MADVHVTVPRMLAAEAGGSRHLEVDLNDHVDRPGGATELMQVFEILQRDFPILGRRLRDETGALRRFVNVYLDGEDVRMLAGLATPVRPGQSIQIIQSVAGG